MPPYKKQKPSGGKAAPQGKTAPQQKKSVVAEPSDEEEESDEDVDEDLDDIDEDVSLDEADFDEMDEEDSDEEEEEEEDDDDEEEEKVPPAKLNGKEVAAKKRKIQEVEEEEEDSEDEDDDDEEEDEDESEEEEEDEKPAAKKAKMNGSETAEKTTKKKEEQKEKPIVEDKSKAVGPLTEDERKMFAANFRAMSATSIFCGKLPQDATDEDLKKLHPAIRTIRRPVSRKGAPATFGFLNFANKETADRALKEINKKGPVKIRGQEILVSENGNGQCHPPSLVDRRKLKIYGCPKHLTKETIQKTLPGCVDVIIGERDRGNSVEAVAVFTNSLDTKKILSSQQTVTLNECVCALFYLNISHNVKQHERKKDRKQAIKQQIAERNALKAMAAKSLDKDGGGDDDEGQTKPRKENVKPQKAPNGGAGKKRPPPPQESSEDDEQEEEVVQAKAKKVSMKTPKKSPNAKGGPGAKFEKSTPRRGTPFKKAKVSA